MGVILDIVKEPVTVAGLSVTVPQKERPVASRLLPFAHPRIV